MRKYLLSIIICSFCFLVSCSESKVSNEKIIENMEENDTIESSQKVKEGSVYIPEETPIEINKNVQLIANNRLSNSYSDLPYIRNKMMLGTPITDPTSVPLLYYILEDRHVENGKIWTNSESTQGWRINENGIISLKYKYNLDGEFWDEDKMQWVTMEEYGDEDLVKTENSLMLQYGLFDNNLNLLPNQLQFDYDIYQYPNHNMYETRDIKGQKLVRQAREINSLVYNKYSDCYIATYHENIPVFGGTLTGSYMLNIILFDNDGKEIKRFKVDTSVSTDSHTWIYNNIMILSENEIYVLNCDGNNTPTSYDYINVETEVVSTKKIHSEVELHGAQMDTIQNEDTMYLSAGLLFHKRDETFYQINQDDITPVYSLESIKKELGVENIEHPFRDLFYHEEKYLYFSILEENRNAKIYRHEVGVSDSLEYLYTWQPCEVLNEKCEFLSLSTKTDEDSLIAIEHMHPTDGEESYLSTVLQVNNE